MEANRVEQYGFGAGELDRARKWMLASYDRAYAERDKTESGSYVQEYVNHFLQGEPTPGIEYEHKLVQALVPTINASDVATAAKAMFADTSRVILGSLAAEGRRHRADRRSSSPRRLHRPTRWR